jgi:hypothetical protein
MALAHAHARRRARRYLPGVWHRRPVDKRKLATPTAPGSYVIQHGAQGALAGLPGDCPNDAQSTLRVSTMMMPSVPKTRSEPMSNE